MKQSQFIEQLSDQELKRVLLVNQLFFIFIAFILSLLFFKRFNDWYDYFRWDFAEIIYFGVLPGLIIVLVDLILIYVLPKKFYDDGGVNERIFKSMNVFEIVMYTLLIAFAEELLFRGVLQTTFGYIVASILFTLVHFRYLKKPVLLISALFVSFFIGYQFLVTENLLSVIFAHFIVDLLLGLIIRFKK